MTEQKIEIISDKPQPEKWVPEIGGLFTDGIDYAVMMRVKPRGDMDLNFVYAVTLVSGASTIAGEINEYFPEDYTFTPWTGTIKVTR
jgi:hypothetical protein